MNKIINILNKKEKFKTPPIWIMRQAGRYLPEYRQIRVQMNGFLDLCYNPKMASEVTLQPIRRFDFDAAIIFSDILVIPDALGVKVEFVKNEGPKLGEIESLQNLKIENIKTHLKPVFENIALTKSNLAKDKALIGFSGAPFTLACYMVEGGGSKNFEKVRKLALSDENYFTNLIEILTNSVALYLIEQIKAGADIVKIFDSWAGILPPAEYQKWVIEPTKKIVKAVKKEYPNIPIICFARASGVLYKNYAKEIGANCIAIDQNVPLIWAKENLQNELDQVIQGNLDNYLLCYGSKDSIKKEVEKILENFNEKGFIFNLGHGIIKETPIENVEFLMKIIRSYE